MSPWLSKQWNIFSFWNFQHNVIWEMARMGLLLLLLLKADILQLFHKACILLVQYHGSMYVFIPEQCFIFFKPIVL